MLFSQSFATIVTGAWLASSTNALANYWTSRGQTRLLGSSFGVPATNASFDYIRDQIIGGGTAGLTVAKRLAEDASISVAIVEAGSFYEIDNGNESQIPAQDVMWSSSMTADIQPLVDWGLVTQPQQVSYTQQPNSGTTGAYQQWADRVGDASYSFENLLPYFKKSVNFTPPNELKRGPGSVVAYDPTAFSSTQPGPLEVSYSNDWLPFSTFVRDGFSKLGLAEIPGLNSGRLLGFGEFTWTVDPRSATRSSSETSFLQQAIENSSTLNIYQRTYAKRIQFSEKTAKGVLVATESKEYLLSARKEVVVSAGVFRSPQMLMVSGIGPKATLDSLKIPVISDLPGVGQNFHDQPVLDLAYRVNVTTLSQLANPEVAEKAYIDYITNQTGPLQSAGTNLIGWEKLPELYRKNFTENTTSDLAAFPTDWPELELLPVASSVTTPTTDSANYASLQIALVANTSRGNVTIVSNDTSVNPQISPNWLSSTTDQQLAVAAVRRGRQVAASWGITVGPEVAPGPSVQTDAELLQYVRQTVEPIYHAAGTCEFSATIPTKFMKSSLTKRHRRDGKEG
ncbi:MAG: hypothetical protein Q9157_002220 [Trypethelium eluteriae]